MTRVDLAALEQLAAEATEGPWSVFPGFPRTLKDASGHVVASAEKVNRGITDAAFIAAADPVTVAALVRAVQAALRLAQVHTLDAGQAERDLDDALAPFRDAP